MSLSPKIIPVHANNKDKTLLYHDVIITGGGPAGIGIAAALQDFAINDYLILEKDTIGASFLQWNKDTRLLTPSFQSTQFGLLDLNAIAINTSPAYSSGKEHLNGREYATYLLRVAEHFKIKIREQTEVLSVRKKDGFFFTETKEQLYKSKYLIWATGEFQFPYRTPFPGAEHCMHVADIRSYKKLEGKEYTIIGGYESGVDAAINLAMLDKQASIIEQGNIFDKDSQDPSVVLSFYTMQRLAEIPEADSIRLVENKRVKRVAKQDGLYRIYTDGGYYASANPPLLATGFLGGEWQVKALFDWTEGYAVINEWDESTKTSGLFLAGPHVRHDNVIFCFIYKFRQRFAVIARKIAKDLDIDCEDAVSVYRKNNMFLDDLSCCEAECKC